MWYLVDTGNYDFGTDTNLNKKLCKSKKFQYVSDSKNSKRSQFESCNSYPLNCKNVIKNNDLCPFSQVTVINNHQHSTTDLNEFITSCLQLKQSIDAKVECFHNHPEDNNKNNSNEAFGEYLNSLLQKTSIVILYSHFNKPFNEVIPIDQLLYNGKIVIIIRSKGNIC